MKKSKLLLLSLIMLLSPSLANVNQILNVNASTLDPVVAPAPEIMAVMPEAITMESDALSESVRVMGQNMTDGIKAFVYSEGVLTDEVTVDSITGTKGGSRTLTFKSQPNTTGAAKVYEVYFGYGEANQTGPKLTITVNPGEAVGVSEPETTTSVEANPPEIMAVDPSELVVASNGISDPFRVMGINMVDGIKAFVYKDGQLSQDLKVDSVIGTKGGSRTLTLKANENLTGLEQVYEVYFGYGQPEMVGPSLKVVVTASEEFTATTVIQALKFVQGSFDPATREIRLGFDEELKDFDSQAVLDNLTYSLDFGVNPGSVKDQTFMAGTTVTKQGKELVITLPQDLTTQSAYILTVNLKANVIAGLTKTPSDAVDYVKVVNNTTSTQPQITNYTIDPQILPKEGGNVTITIEGKNLINPSQDLNGTRIRVFKAGDYQEATDLTSAITYTGSGNQMKATLPLPANPDPAAMSYRLVFYNHGNEIYNRSDDTLNRGDRAVVSVLGSTTDKDAPFITSMTISSYGANTSAESGNIDLTSTTVARDHNSKKTQVKIYGGNLDELKMEVYAVDQNGVIWPVETAQNSPYLTRVLTGISGVPNGMIGGGNFIMAEIILPNDLKEDMEFTYYFAPDGVNYDMVHTVRAKVEATSGNRAVDLRTMTIQYVDQDTQQEIAPAKEYLGYSFTKNPFDSSKDVLTISGYEYQSLSEPTPSEMFPEDGHIIKVFYKKIVSETTTTTEASPAVTTTTESSTTTEASPEVTTTTQVADQADSQPITGPVDTASGSNENPNYQFFVHLDTPYEGDQVVTGETLPGLEVALVIDEPTGYSLAISTSAAESFKSQADSNGKFSIPVDSLSRGQILTVYVNAQGKTAQDSKVVMVPKKLIQGNKASQTIADQASKSSSTAKLPQTGEKSGLEWLFAVIALLGGIIFLKKKS